MRLEYDTSDAKSSMTTAGRFLTKIQTLTCSYLEQAVLLWKEPVVYVEVWRYVDTRGQEEFLSEIRLYSNLHLQDVALKEKDDHWLATSANPTARSLDLVKSKESENPTKKRRF